MLYQQDIEHCFGGQVTKGDVVKLAAALAPACKALAARENKAAAPLLNLPAKTEDLAEIESIAADIRKRFTDVVVAGTGGSGLSGRALIQLLAGGGTPRFHFLENVDPDAMDIALKSINLEKSCFIVISKSGSTVETLSQFYVLLEHVTGKLGKKGAQERFFVITIPSASPMRDMAEERGLKLLTHEPDIGGRFSVLTKVGLLPAAIAGFDIKALRRGAQSVVATLDKPDCQPVLGAALQVAFIRKGYPMTVMLPYSDRLTGFSDWYRQGWAESLGKQGKGSTAIRAVGTTDQHSQLQLYLDGPKDKLFNMIILKRAGTGAKIPAPDRPDLAYLKNKTLGDVMAAEQQATLQTLIGSHCPVRVFALETLQEEVVGAMLMHFMLEIILTAALLEVNPFDQPAVEQGKILARDYLLSGKL